MFSLGETNEGPGKAIWNQPWHVANIKSCEVMVLVQLFIIRIALSNWAAPSYPFSLLLYHTAAPPLSQGAHTHICTVLIWMADFIIIIQWWLPHHNKPQFLLECIPLKCHKIRQKRPIFPSWLPGVYMFSPQTYIGLVLELNYFSHFLKFIYLFHHPPLSFSTLPSHYLLSVSLSPSVPEWPTWAGGAR